VRKMTPEQKAAAEQEGPGTLFGEPLRPARDGATFDAKLDAARLGKQHSVVLALMGDGEWRTLSAVSARTGYPEASISARLRDFRKERFGAHEVERRRRTAGTWEYRLVTAP
jgi:hypothetical protein